ncbi:MAG: PAS domain S-box protein [Armatimonadetes bacterium]|nr:PAS domain S-box protein [Armatimonadota bacterium]
MIAFGIALATGYQVIPSLNIELASAVLVASAGVILLTAYWIEKRRSGSQLGRTWAKLQTHRNILDSHFIVAETDLDGRFLYISNAFQQISQYSFDELEGKTPALLNSHQHDRQFWEQLWKTIRAGEIWRGEICNRAKDGSLYWVDCTISPRYDKANRLQGYIAVQTDITETKKVTEELRDASTLFSNLMSATSEVGIVAINREGIITLYNRGAEKMFGYPAEEVVGKVTPIIFHVPSELEARSKFLSEEFGRPIEGIEIFSVVPLRDGSDEQHWTFIRKDGTQVLASLLVTPLRSMDGELIGFVGIAIDITARKQAENQLEQALLKAEAATRAKSDFLATMSHEIRTPMNGIIGMTDILIDSGLQPEQNEIALSVKLCGESLLTLINDILDISKVEAGKLELNPAPASLTELLKEIDAMMRQGFESKGIEFDIQLKPEKDHHVLIDALRVRQVLLNLLGNAAKFTPEGGCVTLAVTTNEAGPDDIFVKFSVVDTGVGIPKEKQKKIFEAFTQADSSTTRKYGGTGLGLSISNRLVGLMGSKIVLSSELNQGSTFEFEIQLPFAQASENDHVEAVAESDFTIRSLHLLLVEDNPVNQKVAVRILEKSGHTVTVAGNGVEAVGLNPPGRFDAILMDLQMPFMDGFEATSMIRAMEGGDTIPIIALTANAMAGDKERCLAAGMNGYISKPINKDELKQALRSVVPNAAVDIEAA